MNYGIDPYGIPTAYRSRFRPASKAITVSQLACLMQPADRNALEKGLDSLGAAVENGIDFAAGALAALGANIAGVSDGLGRFLSRLASDARAAL